MALVPQPIRPEGLSEAIAPLWDESHGDRQNELVVIGRHMNRNKVEAALQACLLTDEEFAAAPVETWEKVRAVKALILRFFYFATSTLCTSNSPNTRFKITFRTPKLIKVLPLVLYFRLTVSSCVA